jgi:hypothetical protein
MSTTATSKKYGVNGNLIPLCERTPSEQRELARRGGIASGKARSLKATMKRMVEEGSTMEDLCRVAIDEALKGNMAAWKLVADVVTTKKAGVPVVVPALSPGELFDAPDDGVLTK